MTKQNSWLLTKKEAEEILQNILDNKSIYLFKQNDNFYLYWTRRPSRSYAKAGMNRPAGVKTAHSCGHTSS